MSVVIETTIGDITVDLFTEERPVACLNFIKLCKLKYYNYNLFHTVEQGFIAQTGDPTGAGNGGTSVWGVVEGTQKRFFEAESLPKIYHTSAGLLSLVSAGKNLVASQFFLTLGANLTSLDGVHCVIGEVVEGHETLRKLNEAIVDDNFRPYQDIRITHTVVLDDPFPDPRGYKVPSRSPSPSAERLKNGRIAADEDIDDTDGKTMQEIQEMLAEREAKARATILEIVGDLPDADMAPPENVLFVCKLNPVTTDDDLEIIFSRFGRVKTCEVIRDRKTGDSLQYAFVEFEDKKSCEAAYFKMDNVLIDDRRIHVDFSQSVSKVKWRGKGRGVEGHEGRLDFNNLRGNDGDRRRPRPQQRDQNQNNNRARDNNERPRMTSEERRQEREKRHRLQRVQEHNRRRSRSRSPPLKQTSRYGNNNRQTDNRRQPERRPVRDNWSRNEHRRPTRSRSRERERRRDSPDRRNLPQRHNDRRDNAEREQPRNRDIDRRRERSTDREKSNGHGREQDQAQKRHVSKAKTQRNKKSKRRESTSEDESDSSVESESDSTPSESSSQHSSDSSSSEEERKKKKKKKGKSSHKHKSKSSKKKKKKKKHHR